jgi:hypothetical protein
MVCVALMLVSKETMEELMKVTEKASRDLNTSGIRRALSCFLKP